MRKMLCRPGRERIAQSVRVMYNLLSINFFLMKDVSSYLLGMR